MSFTPPFVSPVPRRPLDTTTVYVIGIRFDDAIRFINLLQIPVGRWIYAGDARQMLGSMDATLLVCPGAYKNPKFTEVYQQAKMREFNILYLDEEKQSRK